jgi:hypothetical protein
MSSAVVEKICMDSIERRCPRGLRRDITPLRGGVRVEAGKVSISVSARKHSGRPRVGRHRNRCHGSNVPVIGLSPDDGSALYQGCYEDRSDRALPDNLTTSLAMTPSSCRSVCAGVGKSYAGVQTAPNVGVAIPIRRMQIHPTGSRLASARRRAVEMRRSRAGAVGETASTEPASISMLTRLPARSAAPFYPHDFRKTLARIARGVGIGREVIGQDLERDIAQFRNAGATDDAHPSRAKRG